jgi:carboxymethylenebutenolidase
MTTRLEPLTLQGPHGPIAASLARPLGMGPFPSVLLLHEGVGVSHHLLALAERLAEAGYLALVPDLYTRDSARSALTDREVIRALPLARSPQREALLSALPSEEQDGARRVLAWFDGRNTSTYLADALAAASFLRRHRAVRSEAVASVGFSQGGALSAALATSSAGLAAGVIFYGLGPAPDQAAQVRCPLLGHYAEHDPGVTPRVPALAERLRALRKQLTSYVYPATEHGFVNPARPVYRHDATALAFERTLHFLDQHLRGAARLRVGAQA